MNKETHATFLIRILKFFILLDLREYRPIGLLGCIYKLLAQVLANRLKGALPLIISPFQGSFVVNRKILDGVLVANDLIDLRKTMTKERVIFKKYLEKAYDHVEWDFLDYMLLKCVSLTDGGVGSKNASLLLPFQFW